MLMGFSSSSLGPPKIRGVSLAELREEGQCDRHPAPRQPEHRIFHPNHAGKGGSRTNDVYKRMRLLAGQPADEEISLLAEYYAAVRRGAE